MTTKRREEVKKAHTFAAYVKALKTVAEKEPAVVPSDNRKSQKKRAVKAQRRCIVAAKELLQKQCSETLKARELRRQQGGVAFKPIGLITRPVSTIERAAMAARPKNELLEHINVLNTTRSFKTRCIKARKVDRDDFAFNITITTINDCGVLRDTPTASGAIVQTGTFQFGRGGYKEGAMTRSLVRDIAQDVFVFDFGALKGRDVIEAMKLLHGREDFKDLLPVLSSPSQMRGNQLLLCDKELGWAIVDKVDLLTGKLTSKGGKLPVGKAAKVAYTLWATKCYRKGARSRSRKRLLHCGRLL